MDVNKKYALITGASGGIGSAIAERLLDEGYCVYLHYNKNRARVQAIQEKYPNAESYIVCSDLSKVNGVNELIFQINHPIEHLVLNSGASSYGVMTDVNQSEINEMIQLHITSPFVLTQQLIKHMVTQKTGNIIVITSIWGSVGASCEVLYSMLKGGQNTFVKALAKEVAPSNICVNAIAPGAIETEMLQQFSSEELKQLIDEIPMGRLGKPIEIAELVLFLISNKVPYLSGQVLTVDGGWYT
jgi:3-oxoacyl-[acyl-carrier protein] reductase